MTQRITRRQLFLAAAAAGTVASGAASAAVDPAFWKSWNDGLAEVTSYDLTSTIDNEPRRGVAISIVSAETLSNSLRVKAEPGKHPKTDEFPVVKLNLLKDLQTGISNSHEQLTVFLSMAAANGRPAGFPTKIAYSRQDWQGSLYHQMLFDRTTIRSSRHSYLDGDADQQQEVQYPPAATCTDALWFWARQLGEPFVKRGEFRLAPVLTSLDGQQPPQFRQSNFTRSPVNQRLTMPAGNFEVELCTVQIESDIRKFWVEREAPHRIVRWETSAGERGQLLASERMKYWQLTGKGGEENLRRLKLLPRPPRTT